MKRVLFILFLCFNFLMLKAQSPLFPNSVVSNDIDFILSNDPDTFVSLDFIGLDDKEMPDSQSEDLFDQDTFVFEASFSDGVTLEIWCHSSFGSQAAAQEYAEKLGPRLGKLPAIHRDPLDHVVIHNGNATAFAEIEGNFFILYSENMDARISTNDLEETVFHEAVHASIQEIYANDPAWLKAQNADQAFITEYGADLPSLEDFPETALFAYAYIRYPGRLPTYVEEWISNNNSNKIAFFEMFYANKIVDVLEHQNIDINIYPNPVSERLTVNLNRNILKNHIKIYDNSGIIIHEFISDNSEIEIDLSGQKTGIYFLKVNENKFVKINKI